MARAQSEWDDAPKGRKASSFRPQSEWDDGVGKSMKQQSEWYEDDGGTKSMKPQSEWNDGNDAGKGRKASSFRPTSEWNVGDGSAAPAKAQSEWGDDSGGGQSARKSADISLKPQSEWDIAAEAKRIGTSFRPASEWGDGNAAAQKSFLGDSFLLGKSMYETGRSEYQEERKEEPGKKAKSKSSFRPESEWDADARDNRKSKQSSEWAEVPGTPRSPSRKSEKSTGKSKRNKSEDSAKAKSKSSLRPESEWDADARDNRKSRQSSEWAEVPGTPKSPSRKSEKSTGKSKRNKSEDSAKAKSKSSLRPESEWDADAGDNRKSRQSSEWETKDVRKSRQSSEWNTGDVLKSRQSSEWAESPRKRSSVRSFSSALSEAPEDSGLTPLQRRHRSRSEDGGNLSDAAAEDAEKSGAAAAAELVAKGKLSQLMSLLSLEPPCEPMIMFSGGGVTALAALGLGGFDSTTGLPSTTFGQPIDPKLLQELMKQQAAMSVRFKQNEALRAQRRAYLEGSADLTAGAAKGLLNELRRREDRDGTFVVDPRTMFTSTDSSDALAPGQPATKRGSASAHAQAVAVFGNLFSAFDEFGRPTAGCMTDRGALPLPAATTKVLMKAHKAQAQRFLDFYKPRLDELKRRSASNLFRMGAHADRYGSLTPEGLPVTWADGTELSYYEREKCAAAMTNAAKRWAEEAESLTMSTHAVASLYNQNSAKVTKGGLGGLQGLRLDDVLRAYGANLGRTAQVDALQQDLNNTSSAKAVPKRKTSLTERVSQRIVAARDSLPRSSKGPQETSSRLLFLLTGSKAGVELRNVDTEEDGESTSVVGRLMVSRVLEGSLAEEVGVRAGDWVKMVNDADVSFAPKKQGLKLLGAALRASQGTGGRPANLLIERPKEAPPPPVKRAPLKLPTLDQVHAWLESDAWSLPVAVLTLVYIGFFSAMTSDSAANVVGLVISLVFFFEMAMRLYLWHYVKGAYRTFFLLDWSSGYGEGLPPWRRLQWLHLLDLIVITVDVLFVVAQAAQQRMGGSGVLIVRLFHLWGAVRYLRVVDHLKNLGMEARFKEHAHTVYYTLLSPAVLLGVTFLVITDTVLFSHYGEGTVLPLGVVIFQLLVSLVCILDFATRAVAHFYVLGEMVTFGDDTMNRLDALALVVDLVAQLVYLSGGDRGGWQCIKLERGVRWLLSSDTERRCGACLNVLRPLPGFRLCFQAFCPLKLTEEQQRDLELYGTYFGDGEEEADVEVGKIKKFAHPSALDADEVEAAWTKIHYDEVEHGDLVTASKASSQSSDAMTASLRSMKLSRGDVFYFNTKTGAFKWEEKHIGHLNHRKEKAAKRRQTEGERITFIRELRDMEVEDNASELLRRFTRKALGQWEGTFGGKLPFKHAGRYEIGHRGYRPNEGAAEGYGRTVNDCHMSTGQNSRTFACRDRLGTLGAVVVKVSRKGPDFVAALRAEAGVLATLERTGDDRTSTYFVKLVDSFDFGPKADRFALVFPQLGPSLGYVLTQWVRAPDEDPVFGDNGLDDDEASLLAEALAKEEEDEVVKRARGAGKPNLTGYLHRKLPRTRVRPVPRPPLPLDITLEVTKQLLDACAFLHAQGMVHGDINPDNILFADGPMHAGDLPRANSNGAANSAASAKAKPWERIVPAKFEMPSQVRIKLIDLGSASFIPPPNMPAPITAGHDYGSDEEAAAEAEAIEAESLTTAAAAYKRGMAALLDPQSFASRKKGEPMDLSNTLASPLSASARWLKQQALGAASQPATTLNYRPPELDVMDPWWNAGVDLWGVGCVVAECYAGKADFFAQYTAATSLEPSLSGEPLVARPALSELGRAPLFRAESAFEHLAMVERCVGHLPDRLYSLWHNVDAPPFVSDEARRRVEGTAPSLRDALEMNREALKRDRTSRLAIHKSRLAQATAPSPASDNEEKAEASSGSSAVNLFSFARGGLGPTEQSNDAARAARRALAVVAAEEAAVAVEGWRSDAIHALVNSLLHPDSNQRPSAEDARAHKALQQKSGFMAMLY